jgi:hypothetical protein
MKITPGCLWRWYQNQMQIIKKVYHQINCTNLGKTETAPLLWSCYQIYNTSKTDILPAQSSMIITGARKSFNLWISGKPVELHYFKNNWMQKFICQFYWDSSIDFDFLCTVRVFAVCFCFKFLVHETSSTGCALLNIIMMSLVENQEFSMPLHTWSLHEFKIFHWSLKVKRLLD